MSLMGKDKLERHLDTIAELGLAEPLASIGSLQTLAL